MNNIVHIVVNRIICQQIDPSASLFVRNLSCQFTDFTYVASYNLQYLYRLWEDPNIASQNFVLNSLGEFDIARHALLHMATECVNQSAIYVAI